MAQPEKIEMRTFSLPPDMGIQPPMPLVGRDLSSLRARNAELKDKAASLLAAKDVRTTSGGEVSGKPRRPRVVRSRVVRSA